VLLLKSKTVRRAVRHCSFPPEVASFPTGPDGTALEQAIATWFQAFTAAKEAAKAAAGHAASSSAAAAATRKEVPLDRAAAVAKARDGRFPNNNARDAWADALGAQAMAAVEAQELVQWWGGGEGSGGSSSGGSGGGAACWVNRRLDFNLELQLKDALTIATQALPRWCGALTTAAHFLFSASSRHKLLGCTAFGVSRAVESLQQGSPSSSTRALEHTLTTLNERVVSMYMTGQDPQQLQAQVRSNSPKQRVSFSWFKMFL
jgi:hypothetical protein